MKNGFIYGLVCPLTGQVRYVGQTRNPVGLRFRQHQLSKTHKVAAWLAELSNQGLAAFPVVLSAVAFALLDAEEQKWVNHFSAIPQPLPLLNAKPVGIPVSTADMGVEHRYLNTVCTQKGISNNDIRLATGASIVLISQFCNGKRRVRNEIAARIVDFILSKP